MLYHIIEAETRIYLILAVQGMINEGWTPVGGVFYADNKYLQAMTFTTA